MILIVVILGSIEYSFKKSNLLIKYMKEKDNQILKTKDSVLWEIVISSWSEPFTLPANLKKIDNISEIVDNKLKKMVN